MTTQPIHEHQPRDMRGRFAEIPRGEDPAVQIIGLDGDVVPPVPTEVVWPDIDADPAEAQDMLHAICWDPDVPDSTRALAARGALALAADQHGGPQGLPPGEEAYGLYLDGVADDELLLDAVHELGPFEYPQTQEFGVRLAGAVYDLVDTRRQQRLTAIEPIQGREVFGEHDRSALLDSLAADGPA